MKKKIESKKGVIYDWLDIIVPFTIVFFIFIFMFMTSAYSRNISENVITDINDRFSANQELINFLRTDIRDVVPNINLLPEEIHDMTFSEFFIWNEYITDNNKKRLTEEQMNIMDRGIENVFNDSFNEWQILALYKTNAPKSYFVTLPSYTGDNLAVTLYLKK